VSEGVDFVAIEKGLVSFTKWALGSGIECFFGDDDAGGQPNLPYVMINWMMAPSAIGNDEELTDEDSADAETKTVSGTRSGPRVATISVHFYSNESDPTTRRTAMQMASKFEARLDSDAARERYLTPAGIGINDTSDIRNLPSPRDGTRKRVQHTQMDVGMNLVFNDITNEPVPYVESVEATGQIAGLDPDEMRIPEEDE
jgi:hypothetical protein